LQGSAPIHAGQGPGLSLYDLGQQGGSETVSLLQSEIPVHPHTMRADVLDVGDTNVISANASYALSSGGTLYQTSANVSLAPEALPIAGNSAPHNNMMPYLTLNFNIALQGVFPARP